MGFWRATERSRVQCSFRLGKIMPKLKLEGEGHVNGSKQIEAIFFEKVFVFLSHNSGPREIKNTPGSLHSLIARKHIFCFSGRCMGRRRH